MERSKKTKTTQADSLRSSASDHTLYLRDFDWTRTKTNNHIYFNDEWNGEYES